MSQSDRYTTPHNATLRFDFLPSFPSSKHSESVARPAGRKGSPEAFMEWRATAGKGACVTCPLLPPSCQPAPRVNASDPFPRAGKTRAMPNNCAARSRWNARHASGVQWHTASLWHGQIRARWHCWGTGGGGGREWWGSIGGKPACAHSPYRKSENGRCLQGQVLKAVSSYTTYTCHPATKEMFKKIK